MHRLKVFSLRVHAKNQSHASLNCAFLAILSSPVTVEMLCIFISIDLSHNEHSICIFILYPHTNFSLSQIHFTPKWLLTCYFHFIFLYSAMSLTEEFINHKVSLFCSYSSSLSHSLSRALFFSSSLHSSSSLSSHAMCFRIISFFVRQLSRRLFLFHFATRFRASTFACRPEHDLWRTHHTNKIQKQKIK